MSLSSPSSMPNSFSCYCISSLIFFCYSIILASCDLSSSTTNLINSFFSAFNSSYLSLLCFYFSISSNFFSFLALRNSAFNFPSASFSFAILRSRLSRASLRLKFFSSFCLRAFSRAYSRAAYRSARSKTSSMTPSTNTLSYSMTPVFNNKVPIRRSVSLSFVSYGYCTSAELSSHPRISKSTIASN